MLRKRNWIPGVIAALFLVGAVVWAGEGTWKAAHGKPHSMHRAHAVFIDEDDATEFDLSELAEGEVRVFGSGDKQVTVQRAGDAVTITHEKRGQDKTHTFTCLIDRDTCKVLTFDDDPEKVMIVVEKTRECRNGLGDCDVSVEAGAIGTDDAHVVVQKLVECDEGEECAKLLDLVVEAHPLVHGPGSPDEVVLRCPEGDATLHVDKEEAEDTFLCPKHSVPLERVSSPRIRVIHGGAMHDHD